MVSLSLSDEIIKSLSRNELNILRYVYEHTDDILEESIQEFSRQVSYSPATVLRFCKKLGYSGFAELKYVLRSSRQKSEKNDLSSDKKADSEMTSDRMVARLNYNVQATAGLIREEQLSKTFHYFDSSASIFICLPGGITDITGEYMEKMLLSVGRQNVYRIASTRLFTHLINTQSPQNAVLILISSSGTFGPTVRLGKLAQMKGFPIISITPYTSNEIASLSSVSFRFFTDQRENKGAEYTSRFSAFFIIQTIIQCYIKYKQHMGLSVEGGRYDTTS